MENQEDESTADASSASDGNANGAPEMGDPRFSFAAVTQAVGELMAATPADAVGNPTPCDDFTAKELMEHLILVMRRVAVIGEGGLWSTINEEPQDGQWADSFRSAAHDVMNAWTDPAKLEQVFEVPWGHIPGAPMILTYTAELAAHGWDLAQATGQDFQIEDDLLHGALAAVKFIPAEGREDPAVPFDPPVDVGPDASVLDQIVGWMGRSVET